MVSSCNLYSLYCVYTSHLDYHFRLSEVNDAYIECPLKYYLEISKSILFHKNQTGVLEITSLSLRPMNHIFDDSTLQSEVNLLSKRNDFTSKMPLLFWCHLINTQFHNRKVLYSLTTILLEQTKFTDILLLISS